MLSCPPAMSEETPAVKVEEREWEPLRARITSWLLAEGWQLAEKNHEDAVWLLEASDSQGRHLVVGLRKGKTEQVLLEGAVALSDQHRERFLALPHPTRQDLLWDLRFTLLALGVDFHGVQEPFERVVLGQRIYQDALTRDRFTQRVSQVRNAILAVLWTVARRLDQAAPPPEIHEGGVN